MNSPLKEAHPVRCTRPLHPKQEPRQSKRAMLVVGEASGDLHGANLVKSLYERDSTLEIFGVVGERLRGTRIRVVLDVRCLTVMGFIELVGSLGSLWRSYRHLQRVLREERFVFASWIT